MTVDDTGCAGGASVADFYIVPVEDLAILVFTFML